MIKSRCGIDVLIRHIDVCIRNEGVKDKFRVQISEYKKKKILGRRDVGALLLPTQDQSKIESENKPFEEFFGAAAAAGGPASSSSSGGGGSHSYLSSSSNSQRHAPSDSSSSSSTATPLGVVGVAVACLIALMLPSVGDISPTIFNLPDYLYLTLHQKLLAAYVLGMITVIAFRR